ncbi:Formate-tetrahydrofolate ligase [Sporolituus thermophilus DSM 23256]|uniref:Formate-tetrahydrofolate ligase n=2 Tax=Sporolituus TaxID=909931 RepID=A0A1G7JAF1_9FIRM|nr:Formate-tetrahydrofolate ligase [Sporolituus thermophilus DSM 23256]
MMGAWYKELKVAITVIDKEGKIVEMNDKACQVFEKYGGSQLIGQNVFSCHSESSRQKIARLIANQETNCYTIEKDGVKKLIYQTPWYQNGQIGGLVELSLEIPFEMPHFVRT